MSISKIEEINKKLNEKILGAVARGWCHKETEHLTMDDRLANAITEEVTQQILSLIEELEGKLPKKVKTTKEDLKFVRIEMFDNGFNHAIDQMRAILRNYNKVDISNK